LILMRPVMATGAGSLPHLDPCLAVDNVRRNFPQIPAWPELFNLTTGNSYLHQYLGSLLDLGLLVEIPGKKPYFDTRHPDWLTKQTAFYQLYLDAVGGNVTALQAFGTTRKAAPGFFAFLDDLDARGTGPAMYLKGQLGGPVALGMEICDENGRPAYYDLHLRDLITKCLALHGAWQVQQLKSFGLPVIIAVDEAGLIYHGTSAFITLNDKDIIADLNCVLGAIEVMGGISCLHLCGRPHWPIALSTKATIINFHAYEYHKTLPLYARELNQFLQKGGLLAWGMVPCNAKDLAAETPHNLYLQLSATLGALLRKGIPSSLLRQALITPSCGLSSLTPEKADQACSYTRELCDYMEEYFSTLDQKTKTGA